jgi:ankyrin repeat protein
MNVDPRFEDSSSEIEKIVARMVDEVEQIGSFNQHKIRVIAEPNYHLMIGDYSLGLQSQLSLTNFSKCLIQSYCCYSKAIITIASTLKQEITSVQNTLPKDLENLVETLELLITITGVEKLAEKLKIKAEIYHENDGLVYLSTIIKQLFDETKEEDLTKEKTEMLMRLQVKCWLLHFPSFIERLIWGEVHEKSSLGNVFHYLARFKDKGLLLRVIEKFKNKSEYPSIIQLLSEKNKAGLLPCMEAINCKNLEFIGILLELGIKIDTVMINEWNVFHFSLIFSDPASFDYLIQLDPFPFDPQATGIDDESALHIAVLGRHERAIEQLLKDPRFSYQKNEKNYFGFTPIDLALQRGDRKIIALLDPDLDPERCANFKKMPIRIDQEYLNKKFIKYLTLKKRDLSVLSSSGNCNGFIFLYQYYLAISKENEFYKILEAMSEWNEDLNSLEDSSPVQGFSEGYNNLGDLFEKFIHDLVISQHSTPVVKDVSPDTCQHSREEQYDLMRNNHSLIERVEVNPTPSNGQIGNSRDRWNLHLTLDQFAEILKIYSMKNGAVVEISGERHAITFRVVNGGKFKYYEANRRYRTREMNSPEDMARLIQRTHRQLKDQAANQMFIELYELRFVFSDETDRPEFISPIDLVRQYCQTLPKNSPNGFTPFHLAVFFDSEELFDEFYVKSPQDMHIRDHHLCTPLELAALFHSNKIAKKLLDTLIFPLKKEDIPTILYPLVDKNNDEFLALLLSKITEKEILLQLLVYLIGWNKEGHVKKMIECLPTLDLNAPYKTEDMHSEQLLLITTIKSNYPKIVELLMDHGADPTLSVLSSGEMITPMKEVASYHINLTTAETFINCLKNIDQQDVLGNTLLHYAVGDHSLLIELLLKKGADPWIKNHSGRSAVEIAGTFLPIVNMMANLLSETCQCDAEGKTLLDYAKEACNQSSNLSKAEKEILATQRLLNGAIKNCCPKLVELLMDHGADPTLQEGKGGNLIHSVWRS